MVHKEVMFKMRISFSCGATNKFYGVSRWFVYSLALRLPDIVPRIVDVDAVLKIERERAVSSLGLI